MALRSTGANASTSGVSQGYSGGGASGEALLLLNYSSLKEIASLMNCEGTLNHTL